MFELYSQYSDYLGVVIGLIALIIACLLLPAKIRGHVLTAGLSLAALRIYQIYSNQKKLKEADQQWQKLQQDHQQLKGRLSTLQNETESIREQKIKIEQTLDHLEAEKKRLELSSDQDLQRKQQLDQQVALLNNESEQLASQRQKNISALRAIAAFNRQVTNQHPD